MHDKPDIAALVGSRICHDLISPIGAIGNGIELMLLDGLGEGPEMALISESVAHASARIRFFRIAFGAVGPDQRIGQPEVAGILTDITEGSRLEIAWQSPDDLPRRDVKLIFLLILCLESALPLGGRIAVSRGENRWQITGQGARLRIDTPLWDCLITAAPPPDLTPSQVQFLLAPDEIARQHRRLTCDLSEQMIRLSF